jgi:hypothetical protein
MRLREATATDSPATVEHEEDGGQLPEQDSPIQREVSEADGVGDEFVEDGGLELEAEKFGIVGEQSGVQIPFDRGQIEGVVFEAGVIPHDEEGEDGERSEKQEICDGARWGGRRDL